MIIETLTCAKGKSCQQQVGKFILKYLHFQFEFYLKSIKLNRYELKDGTFAYEYLQMIMENNNGQKLYFLGLKTDKRFFDWPAEKILKKVK